TAHTEEDGGERSVRAVGIGRPEAGSATVSGIVIGWRATASCNSAGTGYAPGTATARRADERAGSAPNKQLANTPAHLCRPRSHDDHHLSLDGISEWSFRQYSVYGRRRGSGVWTDGPGHEVAFRRPDERLSLVRR